ncbi:hypothetical protein [Hymenobacter rigui]|nr:hypothetical protein [Hymenobacter rigui]
MKVTLSSLADVLAAQRRATQPANLRKKTTSRRPVAATPTLPDTTSASGQ